MHGLTHVWDWFWMGFMIVTWVLVVVILVYIAVRFVTRQHEEETKS